MLTRLRSSIQLFLCVTLLLGSPAVMADWRDLLKVFTGDDSEEVVDKVKSAGLADEEIIDGLKQALEKGTRSAVAMLGKEDGYFSNPKVKIPMPDALKKAEKGLRKVGKGKIADNFVETMNRAAEKAAPEAASIFADSVRQMSISDARDILQGDDDAATQYFRRTSSDRLKEKFLPIVSDATNQVGVTSKYMKMVDKLGMFSGLIDTDDLDLDNYVTDKAMDGLFTMVALEEKKIRENPVARTTDLLKKVFGSTTAGE